MRTGLQALSALFPLMALSSTSKISFAFAGMCPGKPLSTLSALASNPLVRFSRFKDVAMPEAADVGAV